MSAPKLNDTILEVTGLHQATVAARGEYLDARANES